MSVYQRNICGDSIGIHSRNSQKTRFSPIFSRLAWLALLVSISSTAVAQVNVVTAHNDIGRTGQNVNETILTTSNVNTAQFGKLFSWTVNGSVLAQPLYVSQVTIPGKGVHNVVYAATTGDNVYAIDADSNGGASSSFLWQLYLVNNSTPQGTYVNHNGVYGTPSIDLSTNTMYLVSSETQSSVAIYRLHALDITTGAEKFGGPVQIQASIPGTGSGSSGGVLAFDPLNQYQRSGLLLLNGVLYIAFGSVDDNGAWHGWIFSYNAATLAQINVFCTTPNGSGSGIWMGGSGLVAEVNNPAKPYGRMFFSTGNGSYAASTPYTNAMSYGMSVVDLDLTAGIMTVQDIFSPHNAPLLDAEDGDLGSGGPILLPTQTLTSGTTLSPLVEAGKSGTIYILDRNNLGGFNSSVDQIPQEVQTTTSASKSWGAGVWGTEAYWNGNIYYGGIFPQSTSSLTAYSFVNGVLSTAPTSHTVEQFSYPSPTPAVSSNGTTNGILWVLNHGSGSLSASALMAYDATNLANLLYSSNSNLSRDYPGASAEFTVPTIANGKVYVGALNELNVYGLIGVTPTVAPPVITPPGGLFAGSQMVTLTDTTPGANIYYTTNGTTPTVRSTLYSKPFTISTNATVSAIASATGYLQGAPVSAVFSSTSDTANPVFSLATGTYTGPQTLTITDATAKASIYYTVDGTLPTTASTLYTGPIKVAANETVQAIAVAPQLLPSAVVDASYDIDPAYAISFTQGFAGSQQAGTMLFNGSTDLDDIRLQLTNGLQNEAGSAFYFQPVKVYAFTTDFTFQLSNPGGDGITFTIQNEAPTALGANARNLGYGGIGNSVAIAFNIYNNSIGMALNGQNPGTSAISLANTGIDLTSGDFMNVHITYDRINLNLTITNAVTLASWTHTFSISIPYHVGSSSAYVGFTGGTGVSTASQKVTYWTYLPGPPTVPSYLAGMDTAGLKLNGGAAVVGSTLQLTNGAPNQTTSAYYSIPVGIDSFTNDFKFQITPGSTSTLADGFTFVIQNAGPTALGSGSGGLGYAGIPNSIAIKFDLFNNAGEGTDSTGVFAGGAMPTVPANNLTPSTDILGNGHLFSVHTVYDGTTLTWTIKDLTHGQSVTEHLAINIPHAIGGNTAYIGFTAASGDGTSIQTVFNWTFNQGDGIETPL